MTQAFRRRRENKNGFKPLAFLTTAVTTTAAAWIVYSNAMIEHNAPLENALPADRESLFYMNVKAIPSVNKAKTENNNVLQLAILSRIKLFVRPNNLAMQPEEALSQLRFERAGNHLKVSNASPYYITLVNLKLGGKTLDNLMVAPKSAAQQVLPAGAGGTLSWQSVNDYGAITPARSVNL